MSRNREEYYKVTGEELELKVKSRRGVPYEDIIHLLMEGHSVFMPVNRQKAYYIKRQLELKLNTEIEAFPSIFKDMHGYLFSASLVRRYLRERDVGGEAAGGAEAEG